MRLLELWQRLEAGERSAAMLPALAQLAAWSMKERAAWLSQTAPLLEADDARLRAAALMILAGTDGVVGLRRVVAALDDKDATVRDAAIAALATSVSTAPARWAHALFHPRLEVRRAAAAATPDAARWMLGWARADPELALVTAGAPWPADALPLVIDLWRHGMVSPSEAAIACVGASVEQLRTFLGLGARRSAATTRVFADAAVDAAEMPAVSGSDALDAVLEILVAAGAGGTAGWGLLADALRASELVELRSRALVAACVVGARHGWNDALARLAVLVDGRWLTFGFVPLAMRRDALGSLWSRRGLPTLTEAQVHALLGGVLVRDGSGAIALEAAAALACLLDARRLRALVDALGEASLLACIAEQPAGWDALCRLPHETAQLWLLGRIADARPAAHPRACALALSRWVQQGLVLDDAKLGALGDASMLLGELLAWLADDRRGHDASSLAQLATATMQRLDARTLPATLAACFACAHDHELARSLLVAAFARVALGPALADDDASTAVERWAADASDAQCRAAIAWLQQLTVPTAIAEALAHRWRDHDDPTLCSFAARVLRPAAPPPAPRAEVTGIRRLGDAACERIATCADDELEAALADALAAPSFGLTDALARRPRPASLQLVVCAALLACVDGIAPVARELERFGADAPGLDEAMLHAALALWKDSDVVPPLVDATLVAFERNAAGFATWLDAEEGGRFGALRRALALPCGWVRRTVWNAAAGLLVDAAWQRRHRWLATGVDAAAIELLVGALDTEVGTAAARMLAALHRATVARELLAAAHARALALAPACTRATLHALGGWLPVGGITPMDGVSRRFRTALPADLRAEVRASTDVAALAQLCRGATESTVHEAIVRLVELGEPGCAALAELLALELPFGEALRDSVALWPEGAALAHARGLLDDAAIPASRRYRIAMALAERREPGAALRAVGLAHDRSARFVRAADWETLLRSGIAERELVTHALSAADPLLVDPAMCWVLALSHGDPERLDWLRRAMVDGEASSVAKRQEVALRLFERGDTSVLPWVLQWALDGDTELEASRRALERTLILGGLGLAERIVDDALLGGAAALAETRVVDLLDVAPLPVRDAALARLLVDGSDATARKRMVTARSFTAGRTTKLLELAQVFAWGVMRGRELTGRRFSFHITPKREQWGYTHIGGAAIHVTPVPILARERHGRDVVEGLVLHEIGHHVWHAGKPAARVWKRAQKEGLFQLLNLVADEHLERNLRSLDADFGDRIKRLDAHAFQHAAREIAVENLLHMLGAAALRVLGEIGPQVAYDPACLRIDSGRLLGELAKGGNSFARFVRALRMGLGNRAGDPVVDTALSYFGASFRNLDMPGLYRVTRNLAALFGDAARLAAGFGGHESVEWNERDAEILGDDIRDADVQREVERILDPPRAPGHGGGRPGRLAINVGENAGYRKITQVRRLAHDAARHRAQADPVRRHALRLRETLQRLGLAHRPVHARLRGHALDRSRVRAVVTRGDPRMLRAREIRVASDLFLGVLVDCSGSMSGANLERARSFAVLVAEAARGLAGVDARFFGFTDTVIYEAGDAQRCAASSLESSGGNNDAAALDHVAQIAAASLRRAKLLVMISDGLPTECSVAALRAVVGELGKRHHMCCAQVAVRPLDEICFPHYVLLDETNVDVAVRRFAEMIGRLVGRALTT